MKLHQVLTGACNAGDRCFAVGSVEGISFITYAAGSNIVILSVTFERIQIIPGICHNNVQISCIDCSTDTGKIAAAYGNKVRIFEPTPLVHHNSSHKLDYHWVETGHIQTEYFIRALSWNLEGTRLLLGGRLLQLWLCKSSCTEGPEEHDSKNIRRTATFELGAENDGDSDDEANNRPSFSYDDHSETIAEDEQKDYELIWEIQPAQPVRLLCFSPDGTLFATAGLNDTLVKVWFQDKPLLFPSKSMEHLAAASPTCVDNSVRYAFEYLAHPSPVVSIEWRKTSKYMPKGSVANMLVTSCEDSICRLWVETILPDDGLVNMNNFDPLAAQNPRFRTHRHKHKFMQRLKHMRHCFQLKRLLKQQNSKSNAKLGTKFNTLPTLMSSYSVHDYHSFGLHVTGHTTGLHFHLAATINAQTDIPLVPSLADSGCEKGFVVHWLNNKEMHFTLQAEYILQELSKKAVGREESFHNGINIPGTADIAEEEREGLKRKGGKVRATTGDLAKFLQHEQQQEHAKAHHAELSSPHSVLHGLHPEHQILSNTASMYSIATDITGTTGFGTPLGDALDHRIDTLLKDWHHSPDLLYAVHPLDGSFLVWLVDWLDEHTPGSFRQAQVSFSSRLPKAVPLGDASTLSTHLALFNPFHVLDLRNLLHLEGPSGHLNAAQTASPHEDQEDDQDEDEEINPSSSTNKSDQVDQNTNCPMKEDKTANAPLQSSPSPVVAMVTKHANGTLNLWHLALNDQSKFTQVLSVSHATRISGHRFRVNNISCHPVLPLLLTTSHHNVVNNPDDKEVFGSNVKVRRVSGMANHGYCSELILWKVETVGPLGKSGGVTELARINSPNMSAFASVAWIPTVLPSSSLGGLSNSASACFVASDGQSLRIYQAVIDARTLLAQILSSPSQKASESLNNSVFLEQESPMRQFRLGNRTPIRVVSEQSTSRPGCILELDAMVEAVHDWKQTQFLHVFQQQLLTGQRLAPSAAGPTTSQTNNPVPEVTTASRKKVPLGQMSINSRMSLMEMTQSAVVDLQETPAFNEPFYVVVVEKEDEFDSQQNDSFLGTLKVPNNITEVEGENSVVHVWKVIISSSTDDDSAGPVPRRSSGPSVMMETIKVCTQRLPLPSGVGIVHASPAAGHLSSASIYPACFAPYVMVTACTDNTVRFWRCSMSMEEKRDGLRECLRWEEWQMISKEGTSLLSIPGRPLSVSAAYSGRIAVAYKHGQSFQAKSSKAVKSEDQDSRYVNLVVSIFECESTGGSEWVREDAIYLKNIHLPRLPSVDPSIDLTYLQEEGEEWLRRRQYSIDTLTKNLSHDELVSMDKDSHERYQPNIQGLLSVPSTATLLTLKKSIEQRGNVCPLTQKHLVQLDWVSKEDGSHILTVGVGHRVLLYTAVSSPAVKEKFNSHKLAKLPKVIPKQASTGATTTALTQEDMTIRWLRLRSLELRTADGLPPLPMHLSWVRDGIFVIGMDNEMQIYSQWKDTFCESNGAFNEDADSGDKGEDCETDVESEADAVEGYNDDVGEDRDVLDRELHTLAQEGRLLYAPSMSHMPRASSMHALAATHLSSQKKTPSKRASTKQEKTKEVVNTDSPSISLLQDCLPSYGLFEASQIASPVLPQYHPQQLMELLNSGKMRWVKAILAHLVRCISGQRSVSSDDEDDEGTQNEELSDDQSHKNWSRTRTLSISSPNEANSNTRLSTGLAAVPEEVTLDYAEITAVPPLPLWLLLAADQGQANMGDSTADSVDSLFHPILESRNEEDEDLDVLLSDSSPTQKRKKKKNFGEMSNAQFFQTQYFQFGPRQARLLTNVLTHTQLPGLSSVDQMHLLALADTLASCDATHLMSTMSHGSNQRGSNQGNNPVSESSLDPCGLRFVLAARHNAYLLRCLPPAQRASLQKQGISSAHLAWAFHSESQEELLQLLPAFTKANPTWAEYRELGIGWWLRSNTLLRRCIEKLAKAAYQSRGDPLDAALYYIAMKKKNIVWGLFRQAADERMTQFFANNFADERWRKAALKNAYALLGKQRLAHAVAFFLLAGSLKDAVDICLTRMHDIQLAMVITRLYEGDIESVPPALKKLLQEAVLDNAFVTDSDRCLAGTDPFLRSIAFWQLAQYTESLNTLLERRSDNGELSKVQNATSASVFNFYNYLRNHPLIIRQHLASSAKGCAKRPFLAGVGAVSVDKTNLQEWITPLERRLYFTTAHAHFLAGCPALALEVLSKLPDHVQLPGNETENNEEKSPIANEQTAGPAKADLFDWSTPVSSLAVKSETSLDFDWSQPVNGRTEETFEYKWSDDEANSDSDDSEEGITMKSIKELRASPGPAAVASTDTEPEQQETGRLDIMAQQLKFIACLKILMGEMATLTTGFEVDGGQLRLQLYLWLDRELQALQQLCNYAPTPLARDENDDEEPSLLPAIPASYRQNVVSDEPVTLHEILMAEKLDLEAKVKRTARRRRWLRANELLVRTLLSYCSVHGSQGGGLASVRMELILLLQELQQDRRQNSGKELMSQQTNQQQLLSPLPFPTSLPLLAASVAGTKIITTDPIRHLENQVHDLLRTIVGLSSVPVPGAISFGQMCLTRDLALALSACLYQALCTSDAWSLQQQQQEQQRGSVGPLARLAVVFRAMHNIAGVGHNAKRDESADLQPTSNPSKWPGVTSLRALLARERDEDTPRLLTLLCEAFVAVYTSLLCYAMAACDAHVLYRLAGLQPTEKMWGSVFGGGTKQIIRVAATSNPLTQPSSDSGATQATGPAAVAAAAVDVVQQRVRLHLKLLQNMGTPAAASGGASSSKTTPSSPGGPRKISTSSSTEDGPNYKEVFVAPKTSLAACLMAKPTLRQESSFIDYDSSSSDVDDGEGETEEDYENDPWDDLGDFDDKKSHTFKKSKTNQSETEHGKPNSISWLAMRLAVTRLCIVHIEDFLRVAGVEPQDLPVISPLSHAIQRALHQWCVWLQKQLDLSGPSPPDYIPGCTIDSVTTGPPIQKYRSLLDPNNTPFTANHSSVRPLRRLWCYLVRQEKVQDIFIRLVFGKRTTLPHHIGGSSNVDSMSVYSDAAAPEEYTDSITAVSGGAAERVQDPVRIIHKDQDSVGAFCINSTNGGILAIANGKEIQELDITPLLDVPSTVLEDECEIDLLGLDRDLSDNTSSYLVVQTPSDRHLLNHLNGGLTGSTSTAHFPSYAPSAANSTVPPGGPVMPVTGRGTTLLRKHKVDGVRRMCAHPLMPLYISGQGDGSVSIWEWGHVGMVSQPRSTGAYAKVTRLRFNSQGNKFGVSDGDGHVALWTLRIGGGSQPHRPFYSNQCHNKGTSDFVFLGSSSVLATTGHSSESRNVILWDTLMPQRKAVIHSFACHENGGTSLVYASQHQLLISAGRKGDVCMWDLRQRTLRHRFTAHESSVAVKCMALDPNEEFFVTGSADGDIKVWSLSTQHVMFAFPAEHSRSSFFRSMGQGHGVSQLSVDTSGRLFSCGADGSMKLRQLPLVNRENVVSTLY